MVRGDDDAHTPYPEDAFDAVLAGEYVAFADAWVGCLQIVHRNPNQRTRGALRIKLRMEPGA